MGQRLIAVLEAKLRELDRVQVERAQRFVGLAHELAQDQETALLLGMLLDQAYCQSFKQTSTDSQSAGPKGPSPKPKGSKRRHGPKKKD
jgi:hypothetical protein